MMDIFNILLSTKTQNKFILIQYIIFSIKGKYGSGTTVKQWKDPITDVLYNGFPYVVWRDGWNNPKCLCQEPNS